MQSLNRSRKIIILMKLIKDAFDEVVVPHQLDFLWWRKQ